ncbi:MAG: biotin--[acetyl-CoA-carboxylase] ligase [Candidatus Cloacimonetes bacterium]|nr:biotin--[acetyl-CoA-carboxylase] ligase [Candidatus Cloacimonadota bacterium]
MTTKLFYQQLDSTKMAHERLAAIGSNCDRWIIRAGTQTAGQGRGDNLWHSPEGGMWLSFDLLYPRPVASFPLYVGFCLHQLLGWLYPLPKLKVKWPNDIYLEDAKLAGILCHYQENRSRYLIGLGLNTNTNRDDVLLELDAAILSERMGMRLSNSTLADLITLRVERNSDMLADPSGYIGYCAEHLHGLGRLAEVKTGCGMLRGVITGLNDEGFLLLSCNNGTLVPVTHGSLRVQ